MVANTQTTALPFPTPTGPADFILSDDPVWSPQSNVSIISVAHLYEFNQSGWIEAIRVWIPAVSPDTTYRLVVTDLTDPDNPSSFLYNSLNVIAAQYNTLSVGKRIVRNGTRILVRLDCLNAASTSTFNGEWRNTGTSQSASPGPSDFNTDQKDTTFRISEIDAALGNRKAELLTVIPNSTISITQLSDSNRYIQYTVLDQIQDLGASVNIEVIRTQTVLELTTGEQCDVLFNIPVPVSTDYVEQANYWSSNPVSFATVTGYLQFDGVDQAGKEDSAFGVDIKFQPGTVSNTWDFAAFTGEA